jgi:hypothetical protein
MLRTLNKHIRVVRADEVGVDYEYQRTLNEKWARKIGEDYDEGLAGLPVISVRKDGTMWWIDGQHRAKGLCLVGRGDQQLSVEVMTGLTVAEEAKRFHQLNDGRIGVRAYDKYKSRRCAQLPIALEIDALLKKSGLRAAASPARRAVAAVVALEQIHVKKGNLAETLHVVRAWSDCTNDDPVAYDNKILRWVSLFLSEFPVADVDVLAAKMTKWGEAPRLIARVKNEHRGYRGERPAETAVLALLDIYNTRNRKKLQRSDRAGSEAAGAAS